MRYSLNIFYIFIAVFLLSLVPPKPLMKQANACYINAIGDYICGGSPAAPTPGNPAPPTSPVDIFTGTLGPLISGTSGGGTCGSDLEAIFTRMPNSIQTSLVGQMATALGSTPLGADLCELLAMIEELESLLSSITSLTCALDSGLQSAMSLNEDLAAYVQDSYVQFAYNSLAQNIASGGGDLLSMSPTDFLADMCSNHSPQFSPSATPTGEWCAATGAGSGAGSTSSSTGTGAGGIGGGSSNPVPGLNIGGTGSAASAPVDGSGGPGGNIANSAINSIGASTADVPATEGGALGCALAVSRILECAGYGVGEHVSTVALYDALEADPCFEIVDTGHINDADLQPGDVLVTKRASRAGHTGVYVGNGDIVSNSSSGFQGSSPGTVQQNYNVDSWSGVTNRNPSGSAVFRRTCP